MTETLHPDCGICRALGPLRLEPVPAQPYTPPPRWTSASIQNLADRLRRRIRV